MSIFEENTAYRPFSYGWAVEAEKKHRISMHWHEDQIELQDDLVQFNSKDGMRTKDVSHEVNKWIVEKLNLVFTEMDVQVGAGYAKLLAHVKNNEIRTLWMTFAAREVTHQRAYALSAETFGYTNSDWAEFRQYAEMISKIDLMTADYGDLSKPVNFAKQLASVLLGEGIALFGAFACLLNLSRFGVAKNFNTINEWSLKDENEHVLNNIKILRDIMDNDLTPEERWTISEFIKELVEKYVEAEYVFLDLVFKKGDQQDLTKEQVRDFIMYLGELRLYQIGLADHESVRENPLDWLVYMLTGSTHTNFFEARVVDYNHGGLKGDVDYTKYLQFIA